MNPYLDSFISKQTHQEPLWSQLNKILKLTSQKSSLVEESEPKSASIQSEDRPVPSAYDSNKVTFDSINNAGHPNFIQLLPSVSDDKLYEEVVQAVYKRALEKAQKVAERVVPEFVCPSSVYLTVLVEDLIKKITVENEIIQFMQTHIEQRKLYMWQIVSSFMLTRSAMVTHIKRTDSVELYLIIRDYMLSLTNVSSSKTYRPEVNSALYKICAVMNFQIPVLASNHLTASPLEIVEYLAMNMTMYFVFQKDVINDNLLVMQRYMEVEKMYNALTVLMMVIKQKNAQLDPSYSFTEPEYTPNFLFERKTLNHFNREEDPGDSDDDDETEKREREKEAQLGPFKEVIDDLVESFHTLSVLNPEKKMSFRKLQLFVEYFSELQKVLVEKIVDVDQGKLSSFMASLEAEYTDPLAEAASAYSDKYKKKESFWMVDEELLQAIKIVFYDEKVWDEIFSGNMRTPEQVRKALIPRNVIELFRVIKKRFTDSNRPVQGIFGDENDNPDMILTMFVNIIMATMFVINIGYVFVKAWPTITRRRSYWTYFLMFLAMGATFSVVTESLNFFFNSAATTKHSLMMQKINEQKFAFNDATTNILLFSGNDKSYLNDTENSTQWWIVKHMTSMISFAVDHLWWSEAPVVEKFREYINNSNSPIMKVMQHYMILQNRMVRDFVMNWDTTNFVTLFITKVKQLANFLTFFDFFHSILILNFSNTAWLFFQQMVHESNKLEYTSDGNVLTVSLMTVLFDSFLSTFVTSTAFSLVVAFSSHIFKNMNFSSQERIDTPISLKVILMNIAKRLKINNIAIKFDTRNSTNRVKSFSERLYNWLSIKLVDETNSAEYFVDKNSAFKDTEMKSRLGPLTIEFFKLNGLPFGIIILLGVLSQYWDQFATFMPSTLGLYMALLRVDRNQIQPYSLFDFAHNVFFAWQLPLLYDNIKQDENSEVMHPQTDTFRKTWLENLKFLLDEELEGQTVLNLKLTQNFISIFTGQSSVETSNEIYTKKQKALSFLAHYILIKQSQNEDETVSTPDKLSKKQFEFIESSLDYLRIYRHIAVFLQQTSDWERLSRETTIYRQLRLSDLKTSGEKDVSAFTRKIRYFLSFLLYRETESVRFKDFSSTVAKLYTNKDLSSTEINHTITSQSLEKLKKFNIETVNNFLKLDNEETKNLDSSKKSFKDLNTIVLDKLFKLYKEFFINGTETDENIKKHFMESLINIYTVCNNAALKTEFGSYPYDTTTRSNSNKTESNKTIYAELYQKTIQDVAEIIKQTPAPGEPVLVVTVEEIFNPYSALSFSSFFDPIQTKFSFKSGLLEKIKNPVLNNGTNYEKMIEKILFLLNFGLKRLYMKYHITLRYLDVRKAIRYASLQVASFVEAFHKNEVSTQYDQVQTTIDQIMPYTMHSIYNKPDVFMINLMNLFQEIVQETFLVLKENPELTEKYDINIVVLNFMKSEIFINEVLVKNLILRRVVETGFYIDKKGTDYLSTTFNPGAVESAAYVSKIKNSWRLSKPTKTLELIGDGYDPAMESPYILVGFQVSKRMLE